MTLSSQEDRNAHYRAALTAYTEAISARDPERVLSLFAKDAVLEDPVGSGRIVVGIEALRPYFTRACQRDIAMRISGHISCSKGNAACAPIRVDVDGSVIHDISVAQFDQDGLIVRYDAYWGPGDIVGPDPSSGRPL
ncbi:MAG: nuclear transport factor 2 family protein [Sphingomonas sp.]|uniref:nuclear transport factor 2 family protein n=1 Tax=Sphingomonas sp. TaxID=28214 RepID=UPI003F80BBDD